MRRDPSRLFIGLMTVATIAVLALVILSPLALRAMVSIPGINWSELSNIGQTYGAVSALLAALALVGVAASVIVQNRELRHNRWEAGRTRHFDVMRIALDNPFFSQVFSKPDISDDEDQLFAYINLVLNHWIMMWEFGDMSEMVLRSALRDILETRVGSSYWRMYGKGWIETAETKRERALLQIADQVYRESVQSFRGGGKAEIGQDRSTDRRIAILKAAFLFAFIGVCAAIADRILKNKMLTRNANPSA
jgi:Family of unknown function (DUF6082)